MRRLLTLLLILILNAQWIGSAAASIPHFSFSGPATNQGTASPAPPAGATFTPTAPALFSSAAQLSLLAPVGQSYLLSLLPPELRPGSTTFLMDAWLEQQTLRQAALRETGQSTFIAGLAYDAETGLSVDSQQRALLYQAAARFATAEGIQLGTALSDAQQTKLTEPLLWYVEETITGPDGKTLAALVPKLYLPAGQLDQWANVAGGVIRGQDITLDAGAGTIDNTGYVIAGNNLTVNADELVNQARSAAWGSYTQGVEGGYVEVSGDRVQPGGFLSAATLDLNATRIQSISGTFLEAGQDKTAELKKALGANLSQSQNIDHTVTQLHVDSGFGLEQLVMMAVAIAVSVYTAGAASEMMVAAAGESATAAATAAGATAAEATATGTLAASQAAASVSTAMISGAAGAMASSAVTGVLSGNFSLDNVLKSGLTAGLTAGLTSAPLFDGESLNQMAGVQNLSGTGSSLANGNFSNLGQNLAGIAGRGLVNAGVNTAIYGGSFGTAFKQSVISDAAAVGANVIGQTWGGGQNPAMQTLAHAGLGAVVAKARGQDALAGAIGGATESALGNLVDAVGGLPIDPTAGGYSRETQALYAAAATFAGGALAISVGKDGATAAQTAQNAAVNNYLSNWQQAARNKEIAACQGNALCKIATDIKWMGTSAGQDARYLTGMALGAGLTAKEMIASIPELPGVVSALLSDPSLLAKLPAGYAQQVQDTFQRYTTALEAAGPDGATAAGVEFIKLASLVAPVVAAGQLTVSVSQATLSVLRKSVTGVGKVESVAVAGANTAARLDQATIDGILSTGKGLRPDPATYLSQDFIDSHLAQFDGGVTKFSPAVPSGVVGPPGGTFVMPKSLADSLVTQSGGNVAELERLLSLDSGTLGTNPVRIDIPSPNGLRMPSGNELGANKQWIPGGYTGGGIPEATINPAQLGTYIVNPIFH